jgi:hypothetical protein
MTAQWPLFMSETRKFVRSFQPLSSGSFGRSDVVGHRRGKLRKVCATFRMLRMFEW